MHPIPRSSNGAPWITDRRSGLRRKSSQRAATKNSKNCARQLIYSAVRRSSSSVDNSEICYICFIIAPQTRQLKPQLEVEVEVEMLGNREGVRVWGVRRSEAIFIIIVIISISSWRAPHTCAHIKKQVSQVFKSV